MHFTKDEGQWRTIRRHGRSRREYTTVTVHYRWNEDYFYHRVPLFDLGIYVTGWRNRCCHGQGNEAFQSYFWSNDHVITLRLVQLYPGFLNKQVVSVFSWPRAAISIDSRLLCRIRFPRPLKGFTVTFVILSALLCNDLTKGIKNARSLSPSTPWWISTECQNPRFDTNSF